MTRSKILVVYFSRSGHTRQVAQEIARQMPCEIDEIHEPRGRLGFLGFLRSAYEARFRKQPDISPPRLDPAGYDLVIVGTPVWGKSLASPVRTYLSRNQGLLKNVAFFLTHGGSGRQQVFGQMQELCARTPLATLAVREAELHSGAFRDEVAGFVRKLRRRSSHPWAAGAALESMARELN